MNGEPRAPGGEIRDREHAVRLRTSASRAELGVQDDLRVGESDFPRVERTSPDALSPGASAMLNVAAVGSARTVAGA